MIITNKDGFIEYGYPAFEKLTGYDNEESIGNTPNMLKSGKHDKNYYKSLYETIYSGKVFQDEFINTKKNGEIYYAETTIVPIKDAQGTITHFVDNILTSGNFPLNLISDILDLSKVEAGKMELGIEKIHVPEVINESHIMVVILELKVNSE